MTNALIIVDLQNDFCPGGSLAVKDGDKIVPLINQMIEKFDVVVATQDWHPANHSSFKENGGLWPSHCAYGTPGAMLHKDLAIWYDGEDSPVIPWVKVIQKGMDPAIDSYSAFYDNDGKNPTGLAEYLREMEVESITIVGLCVDFCVKATALDSVKEGFKTFVAINACCGVAEETSKAAVKEMKNAGVHFIEYGTDGCMLLNE